MSYKARWREAGIGGNTGMRRNKRKRGAEQAVLRTGTRTEATTGGKQEEGSEAFILGHCLL